MLQPSPIRRMVPPLFALAVVGLVIAGVIGLNLATPAGASQETNVTLVAPGAVRAGEPVTLQLVADNARNLAGFQGAVSFDTTNLSLQTTDIANGLKASGRDILPFSPIARGTSVVLGAATCPVASCTDMRGARAPRVTQGVDGHVDLATLTFVAQAPGQYELRVSDVKLVDPQGNQLATTTANITLTVNAP